MSRWPPTSVTASPEPDGSLLVQWAVETFFADSEVPQRVVVLLNHAVHHELDGNERDLTIPARDLAQIGTSTLVVEVGFGWDEGPLLYSGVTLHRGHVANLEHVAAYPPKVLERRPKTLRQENSITIEWSVNAATDVAVVWGPADRPAAYRFDTRPRGTATGADYTDRFTTDKPLAARTSYRFSVQARNSFHDANRWVEAAIGATSADNFHSVRQFLQASGVTTTNLRGALGGQQRLRSAMGL